MRIILCILLACITINVRAQKEPHSYFRFKAPPLIDFNQNISFKSKETTFVKKSNGEYEAKVRYYVNSLFIYAILNDIAIDSFEAKNRYKTRKLLSDELVFDESLIGSVKTKESLQTLSNLRVQFIRNDTVATLEVVKIIVLIDKKNGSDRVRTYFLNKENNFIDLKKTITMANLITGDRVIFSGIIVLDHDGKKKKVPGFSVDINTQEEIDKFINHAQNPMTAKTYKASHLTTGKELYLKGMVSIGSQSSLQTNASDTNERRKEIEIILSNLKIKGMTGMWEIYYKTGALYAKGTIINEPEYGIYTLGKDWVFQNQ